MGAFIDNEVTDSHGIKLPYSHAAGFYAEDRIDLIACSDLRADVMEAFGLRYDVPKERQYIDFRELIEKEQPDIVSVATQPEQRAEIVIHAAEQPDIVSVATQPEQRAEIVIHAAEQRQSNLR
jgi:predicted dehydrogenase